MIKNVLKLLLSKDGFYKLVFNMICKTSLKYSMPDKAYISLLYRVSMGRPLNLKKPVTFNEKLQWLKLYDRNPLYTQLVDKLAVKQWVTEKMGGG